MTITCQQVNRVGGGLGWVYLWISVRSVLLIFYGVLCTVHCPSSGPRLEPDTEALLPLQDNVRLQLEVRFTQIRIDTVVPQNGRQKDL